MAAITVSNPSRILAFFIRLQLKIGSGIWARQRHSLLLKDGTQHPL